MRLRAGTSSLGPRTAYGDDEGRARTEVKPAHLSDAGGVRYQEFSNLNDPVAVVAESDGFDLSAAAQATDWVDGLISEGAKVIVGYDHPHFGRFPAVVSTAAWARPNHHCRHPPQPGTCGRPGSMARTP